MKLKRRFVIIGVIIVALLLSAVGIYQLMNARGFQLFGTLVRHVDTNEKVVAITFDDGPTKQVDKLLPLLDEYQAKATFFLIGNELEKNLEEGKKIADAGHQIGNHSYSHQRMVFKSPSFFQDEVDRTNAWIRKTGFTDEIMFRPPYGKKLIGLPYYLNKLGMKTIMWDVEPDTNNTSVDDKVHEVMKKVQPGSIILLHPMYDQTGGELEVVKKTLSELSKQGYRFVTVNELLSDSK